MSLLTSRYEPLHQHRESMISQGKITERAFVPHTRRRESMFHHHVRNMIDNITSTTEKLIRVYEENDNAREDEIAALGGQIAIAINVFSAFYDRLKEIREYHRKHPVARVVGRSLGYATQTPAYRTKANNSRWIENVEMD